MAGRRGRERCGLVRNEEVQHHDRIIQEEHIADLQRQVAELTQRLAAQDLENEITDHDSDSTFDNPFHHRHNEREARGRDMFNGSLGFRVELPEFAGTLQAEGFIDWIDEVERIFDYKEVPEQIKVKLVAIKLKGRASTWWEQLCRSRHRQGKSKITDWGKMKKKLKSHFLPFRYTQILFQRLHSLRQNARTVDEYTEEFYQLIARNNLSETEEQLVARYMGGLRQPLQDALSLHTLWTVSEEFQRALAVRPSTPAPQGPSNPTIRCFRCGEQGHRAANCRKPANQKSTNLLIEEEDYIDAGDEPTYDDEAAEDVLYGDGHETLVSEITVDRRCLVSFSIGKKYFDNAWCDIVSMDTCHVLLG
ncbi:CCCH-type zinc finger family protein [Salix suchowensis]|nr:CCCH-type zinc finger family protein [Salix suchowensis]